VSTFELKVEKFGRSLKVRFPEELVEQLNVREGDRLYLVESGNRDYLLSSDPEFPGRMKRGRKRRSRS
jgi:antitoxin component of MazEF toxin-antitoxin module